MRTDSIQKRDLAAATRGLIVQRVLVDGWTPEKAGAQFGVDGRIVARWVAAYRRHGMAALRAEAAGTGPRRWIEACLAWIGLTWTGVPRHPSVLGAKPPFAQPSDRDGAPRDPTRRWRSY
jgi:Homeodomain-like domain-containing protein